MKAKVEYITGYMAVETVQDGIELLKLMRSMCHEHDNTKQETILVVNSDKRAYIFYQ